MSWPPPPLVTYGVIAFLIVCLIAWMRDRFPSTDERPIDKNGNRLEYVDLVEVFVSTDPNQTMFVKSLLGGSGIKHHVQGEITMGRGFGHRRPMPVRFLVPADQADDARALLKNL